MSVTNDYGLKHIKIYNNIAHDSILQVMINSFLHFMIHTTAEQKVDGKHNILTYEPTRKHSVFHMMHILQILRAEPMEYFYSKIFFSEATVNNYSKQAILSISDYIEIAHCNVKIFMQLLCFHSVF